MSTTLRLSFLLRLAATVLCAPALFVCSGCSEKPLAIVWESALEGDHLNAKCAFTAVVHLGPQDEMAVGHLPRGGLSSLPVAFRHTGPGRTGKWVRLPVTGHESQSTKFLAACMGSDGVMYACGGAWDLLEDFASSHPVLYQFTGGAWNEVSLPIPSLFPVTEFTPGVQLTAIIALPGGDLLAAGPTSDLGGVVFRRHAGVWTSSRLPTPGPGQLTPTALALGADGRAWISCTVSDGDGVIFHALTVNNFTWEALDLRAPHVGEGFTCVGVDPSGGVWVGGEYAVADSLEGALYRVDETALTAVPIRTLRPVAFRLNAFAFRDGTGYVVGTESPFQSLLAEYRNGAWQEMVVARELSATTSGEKESGGTLLAVSIQSRIEAFAVGWAEEFGEGGQEVELVPRAFYLDVREEGEIDKPTMPVVPGAASARRTRGR